MGVIFLFFRASVRSRPPGPTLVPGVFSLLFSPLNEPGSCVVGEVGWTGVSLDKHMCGNMSSALFVRHSVSFGKLTKLVQAACVRHPWRTEVKLAIVFTYFFFFLLLVQAACVRHPWWQTEAKGAIVFTYFILLSFFFLFLLFFFYIFCFSPTLGILRKLKLCLPS